MRHLHELLWYLTEALTWELARPGHDDLRRAMATIEDAAAADAAALARLDVNALRDGVAPLLRSASAAVRGNAGIDRSGADLVGADLRGVDLRNADLRGAQLIAADLRGVDLQLTDLLGADLRDADVRGADLGTALFVTQPQVSAAKGDAATHVPAALRLPTHWRLSLSG
jgi:uncharacterized protein YjbI with pentapeptide repeats